MSWRPVLFTLALPLAFLGVRATAAPPDAPIVTMSVTTPDGRTQNVSAPESGLATVTLTGGREYAFRPTIQDSAPWNRILVTIFKTATSTEPEAIVGEVELKRGGPAVASRSNPSFKISVTNVSAPPSSAAGSSS